MPGSGRPTRDDVFATYVEWRQAAVRVSETYARWVHARAEDVEQWFHSYNAALDQEDAAARTYAVTLAEGARWLRAIA